MVTIVPATIEDCPVVQNMWLYYIYDMGRECGFNEGWECPTDISFKPDDLTPYFTEPTKKAYLIKVNNQIAGFILLNKIGTLPQTEWNMGEFYIVGKFQGKGIGRNAAHQIWDKHPGLWEVSVIPENKSAHAFWRSTISQFTGGIYHEEVKLKDVRFGRYKAKRVIFSFDSKKKDKGIKTPVL